MDLAYLLLLGAVFSLQSQYCHNFNFKNYDMNRIKRSHEAGSNGDHLSRRPREEPSRVIKVYQVESDSPRKLNYRLYPDNRKKSRSNIGVRGFNGVLQSSAPKSEIRSTYTTNNGIALTPHNPVKDFEVFIPHHQRRNVNEDVNKNKSEHKLAPTKQLEGPKNITKYSEIKVLDKNDDIHDYHHDRVTNTSKHEGTGAPAAVMHDEVPTPKHFEVNSTYHDVSHDEIHTPIKHDEHTLLNPEVINTPVKLEEIHTVVKQEEINKFKKPDEIHTIIQLGDNHQIHPTHEENINKHDEIIVSHNDDTHSKPICPLVEGSESNINHDVLKATTNTSIIFFEEPETVEREEINTVKAPNIATHTIEKAPSINTLLNPNIVRAANPSITTHKEIPELTAIKNPKKDKLKKADQTLTTEHSISDESHHNNIAVKDVAHELHNVNEIKPHVAQENVHCDHVPSNLGNKAEVENTNKVVNVKPNHVILVLTEDSNKLNNGKKLNLKIHNTNNGNEHRDSHGVEKEVKPESDSMDDITMDGGIKVNKDPNEIFMIQDQNCEEVLEGYKTEVVDTLEPTENSGYVQYYLPNNENIGNDYSAGQSNGKVNNENSYIVQYYDYGNINPYLCIPQSIYNPVDNYESKLKDSTKYSNFKLEIPEPKYNNYYKHIVNPETYKNRVRRTWNNRQILIKRADDPAALPTLKDNVYKGRRLCDENKNIKYPFNHNRPSNNDNNNVIAQDGYYRNQNIICPYHRFRSNA